MPIDFSGTLPFNHDQAVEILLNADWDPEEIEMMIDGGVVALHHGFGTAIRNCWGLTEKTYPLSRYYQRKHGIGHCDDMSHLILADLVSRLKNEPFSLEHEVLWLKRHWMDQGVDPLTLERSI